MFFRNIRAIIDTLSKRERTLLFGAFAVCGIASILWTVHALSLRTVATPAEGGSYTEGVVGQPTAINPLIAVAHDADQDLMRLTFAGLATLTERIQENEDHTTWSVTLKNDLLWSDGSPLTSDDVVFTIERIQDPETRSPLLPLWQGIAVERLSERETRFTLKAPYAFFEENLKGLRIVPHKLFEAIPGQNLHLSAYNLEPVGSGPYAFATYTKRKDGFITDYELAMNEYFAGPRALIPSVRFRFFRTLAEAIEAFNRKEIDGLGGIEPSQAKEFKVGYAMQEFPMPRYYALFLNAAVQPALKAAEVREALEAAIDRDDVIKHVFDGRAEPVFGPFPPTLGISENKAESRLSPEEIKEMLAKKGWKENDRGVLAKTSGKETIELSFELIAPNIRFLAETAELVKRAWAAVGIRTAVTLLDPSDVARDTLKTRNYQILLFGNMLSLVPDVFSFWHSSERFAPGLNLALYENKDADALLESIRKEFDADTRLKLLKDFEGVIREDRPAIFLFSPFYLYAHSKQLKGIESAPIVSPADRFLTAPAWFIRTSRVLNNQED